MEWMIERVSLIVLPSQDQIAITGCAQNRSKKAQGRRLGAVHGAQHVSPCAARHALPITGQRAPAVVDEPQSLAGASASASSRAQVVSLPV